jgi:hypothetical protein
MSLDEVLSASTAASIQLVESVAPFFNVDASSLLSSPLLSSSPLTLPILFTALVGLATLLAATIFILPMHEYLRTLSVLSQTMPAPSRALPFFGHVFQMIAVTPWDLMTEWHAEYGSVYRFVLFGRNCVSISDPDILKEVLHNKHTIFKKDIPFTYAPFMPLLGQGLVTADGKAWRDQRTKVSSALRIDILEEIPRITVSALERLFVKLDGAESARESIELGEEFRALTLQVISEAILSLPAEESDESFALMYLPIVEEGNKNVRYMKALSD